MVAYQVYRYGPRFGAPWLRGKDMESFHITSARISRVINSGMPNKRGKGKVSKKLETLPFQRRDDPRKILHNMWAKGGGKARQQGLER